MVRRCRSELPSPPFRGEREGTRRACDGEGEVGFPHIPGIDQPVGDLRCHWKARIERDQPGVAMHQHRVELAAHALDGLAVPRRVVAHHDDVAHRADQPRPRRGGMHRLDQRVELEAEGAPGKWKALDDDRIGPRRVERREQIGAAPRAEAIVERPAGIVDQLETRIARSHRRQLHNLDRRVRRQFGNRRSAAHQRHPNALPGERVGDAQRALQVSDPQ